MSHITTRCAAAQSYTQIRCTEPTCCHAMKLQLEKCSHQIEAAAARLVIQTYAPTERSERGVHLGRRLEEPSSPPPRSSWECDGPAVALGGRCPAPREPLEPPAPALPSCCAWLPPAPPSACTWLLLRAAQPTHTSPAAPHAVLGTTCCVFWFPSLKFWSCIFQLFILRHHS